ncbi:terpene cyclase/mutase family protein [Candidatus Bathyarchaeota archaeon]|nr:terpene cyclase/mutase family protein [Candidatus Bathyarchaeota archaeon]
MNTKIGFRSLFKREPLDCDYVYKILADIFDFIDCEKHVTSLVQNQEKLNGDKGAWSESFTFKKGDEAPLATAEAILALLGFHQRSDVNSAIRRAYRFLIESQNDDGGWKDLVNYSVNDATGCIIAALSEAEKKSIQKVPKKTLDDAVKFIVSQQNDDGGWGAVKQEKSKIHYTFFALWGLASSKDMLSDRNSANSSVEKGVKWILDNSTKNNDDGLGLSLDDAPSPAATALGTLCCLNIDRKDIIKPQWTSYLKARKKNGGWEEISDVSMVYGERRVYDFRSIPWIVEALVRSGEKLNSKTVRDALRRLKKYELPSGGFVNDVGKANPVVWHTSWSIRMMQYMVQELHDNLRFYVDNSIKNTLEMNRKIENYEKELNPERGVMKTLGILTVILSSITTYLLHLTTSSSYGKLVWDPFAIASSLAITVLLAYYWYRRRKLNKFRIFLLSVSFSAINILLGLII